MLAERALVIAEAAGWPALSGSDKQVAWAQDIRMTAVAAIVDQAGDDEAARPFIASALARTEARWWIDRRGFVQPLRGLRDLIDEPGVARATYGSLLDALRS
ncbi:hypothetical protein [Micromonospora aurantiaca (nom. illeg.)]|uniref:hypothetical protein n=1 Tax=Micromonospora aurantiaca (nom. illeg.) TaxID=47850 RepID=UPI0033DCFCD4